jgi:type IV pilus assembly protein PilA
VRRGFTLVELMIVVAIVGVLAALAMYGFRKYQLSSKTGEATAMLSGMRGAQEAFKAENLAYLNCTATSGQFIAGDYYPRALGVVRGTADGDRKFAWDSLATDALTTCFRRLGARSDGPVVFVYATTAGAPGPTAIGITSDPAFNRPLTIPAPREPWYVAIAAADRDGDSVMARLMVSSVQNEVYVEDDTE